MSWSPPEDDGWKDDYENGGASTAVNEFEAATNGDHEGHDGCANGENGQSKAEDASLRVFKGECRICKQEGHPAVACPEKPAPKCFNCKEEGHETKECKSNRVFDYAGVEDLTAQDAWDGLLQADRECDLDDVRKYLQAYSRAVKEVTYAELETTFRQAGLNTYLIATKKELPKTLTYVDLQGELDKTYQVGFHLSDKPRRSNAVANWPKDAEENLDRLKDAGLPMERGIPKCSRCDELGHSTRACTQEAFENTDRTQVKCVNCNEVGHRARDCPVPRVDRFACRNCKKSGHSASECPEPRSAEGVECKRCNEIGHFAKDCPNKPANTCKNCGEEGHFAKECDKPRNPETVTCRNCEEMGHFSRDCPKPRDYSKVKCMNCGEMGHTKVRCKNPATDAGDDGFGGDNFATGQDDFDNKSNGDSHAVTIKNGDDGEWGREAAAAGGDW